MNFPSGHFHCLMLSGDADANMLSLGCATTARTDFLWLVRVHMDLPAARSHRRMVWSWLPVITCVKEIEMAIGY